MADTLRERCENFVRGFGCLEARCIQGENDDPLCDNCAREADRLLDFVRAERRRFAEKVLGKLSKTYDSALYPYTQGLIHRAIAAAEAEG